MADELIDTPVGGIGVTVIERLFDPTTGLSTQAASLVITQLMTSLLLNAEVVYVGPPDPESTPLTIH